MIELFLDGLRAIPKDNASIKVTLENPYFTKSASYTYDIELPLDIDENRRIFGYIGRIDVSKEERCLTASLMADNNPVVIGLANITSVTETAVKIQILGGNAAYNQRNKLDKVFIDELDLGDWYDYTWPDGSWWDGEKWRYSPGRKLRGNTSLIFWRTLGSTAGQRDEAGMYTQINNICDGNYPWVAYPVINSTCDFVCNPIGYYEGEYQEGGTPRAFYIDVYDSREAYLRGEVTNFAVQPFVYVMAELIAKATGMTLKREDNALYTDPFLRRIFIVNANNCILCNKCLPHWSVNDWWTYVEDAFGVAALMDPVAGTMEIVKRSAFYNDGRSSPTVLAEVVDGFTAEIGDETNFDISVASVGFDGHDNCDIDILPEIVMNNAVFNDAFTSTEQLAAWFKTLPQSQVKNYKNVIFRVKDGRWFIISTKAKSPVTVLLEVNMLRPRCDNSESDDVDVSLKFVPASWKDYDIPVHPASKANIALSDWPKASIPFKILVKPDISNMEWYKDATDTFDIDSYLNNSDDTQEEHQSDTDLPDVVYIALANFDNRAEVDAHLEYYDGVKKDTRFRYPAAITRQQVVIGSSGAVLESGSADSLSLIPVPGQNNLANSTIADSVRVNSRIKHCFSFVSSSIPNPNTVFLIRNKRFVCEKIEINVSASGLDRLMTGYFYELES